MGGQNIELANKSRYSRALLEKAFQWARETGPAQPVFASLWPRYRFIGWDNLNSLIDSVPSTLTSSASTAIWKSVCFGAVLSDWRTFLTGRLS